MISAVAHSSRQGELKLKSQFNSKIVAFIDQLDEMGSKYRIDEMNNLYAEELGFLQELKNARNRIERFRSDQEKARKVRELLTPR